jgi:VanZ family protein
LRETAATRIDVKFLILTAAAAVFILYASFYPFRFQRRPGSPLDALLATARAGTSRSDVLSNVMLYLPLGFFAAHVFRRGPRALHILVATLAAAACSGFVELLQFYDASRVPAMADLYANTAGSFLGSIAGAAIGGRVRSLSPEVAGRGYFALLLLGAWAGYRLFPYVPTMDFFQYKTAIKPLIFSPHLSMLALYRHFTTGLVCAVLIAELAGTARSRLLAPACLLGVLAVRVTLSGVVLSPSEVAGSVAAAFVWTAVLSYWRFHVPAVAAAVAVMIVLQSLEPFVFLPTPRPFGWIPFRGFFRGSTVVNILSMFEKILMYGSMVWLLEKSGCRLAAAAAITAAGVLLLRVCQTYLPGRSAEITDAVMVILLAATMALLRRVPAPRALP